MVPVFVVLVANFDVLKNMGKKKQYAQRYKKEWETETTFRG